MADKNYKKRVSSLIKKAKEKGLVKTYDEFCKTDKAKKIALSEDDVAYYTSKQKGDEQNEKI